MHRLPRRLPEWRRWCTERGVLPFALGALRQRRHFERNWRNGVPRTFNEKLQYKLIHDRRPIVRTFSDKLAVRAYVRERAPDLALPRLLGVFNRVDTLLERLPAAPWVMKGAHGSGMVLLACPPAIPSRTEIARHAHEWLSTDYALRYWEWQYFRLPRRIMFEEFLGCGREAPSDYKFYVIHQQVRLITVDEGRFTHHTRNLFTTSWREIPSRKGHAPRAETPPARPQQLPTMLEMAARLAVDTDFIRVDLYVVDGKLYFGELTHAPAAGDMDFEDPELDLQIGEFWQLPPTYQ